MSQCPTHGTMGQVGQIGTKGGKSMYHLEKYVDRNSRHECPQCHDRHSFAYYVDKEGNYLDKSVGRCNHESSCSYHYTPRQFFIDNPERKTVYRPTDSRKVEVKKKLCTIPVEYVTKSESRDSNLLDFLNLTFEAEAVERACSDYKIGATKDRRSIFWQIDYTGRVRTGKVIAYDATNGHRVKSGGGVDWIHSIMKRGGLLSEDWELSQCLFGEHLLRVGGNESKVVAIVESEKSALIGSIVYPNFIWVATGGKSQMSVEKMKVLSGRTLVMFPDVDAFQEWSERSKMFSFCKVMVSDILEKGASSEERSLKIDIADWIIKEMAAKRLPKAQEELSEIELRLLSFEKKNPVLRNLIKVFELELVV